MTFDPITAPLPQLEQHCWHLSEQLYNLLDAGAEISRLPVEDRAALPKLNAELMLVCDDLDLLEGLLQVRTFKPSYPVRSCS